MGSQDVAGWAFIVSGVVNAGRAFRPLVQARRSGTRSAGLAAEVSSGLLVGLAVLVVGVFYLRYPYGASLRWIGGTLLAAALILMVAPWIVSRRRARRLDPSPSPSPVYAPGPGPAFTPDTAVLIERIKNVTFSTVRLVPGYDEEEVDIFLDKLVAALSEDGQLGRSELRGVTFSTTRLRPGYTMPDVDAFLECA